MRALLLALACFVLTADLRGEHDLSVDCVFCGPGQPIPHHCPHLQGVSGGGGEPLPPPPLTRYIDQAVRARMGLLAAGATDLPDLGEPGDLEALDAALAGWVAGAQASLDRLQRGIRSSLDSQVWAAQESARLHNLGIDLQGRLPRLRRQLELDAAGLGTCQEETARLQAETRDAGGASRKIRFETRRTLDRTFRRMAEAERRGWILPPSAYRRPPSPLPVTEYDPQPPRGLAQARPVARAGGLAQARAPGEPVPGPASPFAGEASLDEKLRLLESLEEPLRRASANLDGAFRGAVAWNAERDREASRLQDLQLEHVALEKEVAEGRRRLAEERDRAAGASRRLADARRKALCDWIEWGIGTVLDKRAEKLMEEAMENGVNLPLLLKIRDVNTAAVQLGSDTLSVIERFPESMAGNGESMAALQRELDGAKQRFGLAFLSASTDIPAPLLPYLTKER